MSQNTLTRVDGLLNSCRLSLNGVEKVEVEEPTVADVFSEVTGSGVDHLGVPDDESVVDIADRIDQIPGGRIDKLVDVRQPFKVLNRGIRSPSVGLGRRLP